MGNPSATQHPVNALDSQPPIRQNPDAMFAGSLIVGLAVIMVAVWLEHSDSIGAAIVARRSDTKIGDGDASAKTADGRYHRLRRRWRKVIHALLATCGGLMIAAGWAGPGRFWIAAWTAVVILMMCIVVLALADALRTHHHQMRKLAAARDAIAAKLADDKRPTSGVSGRH